nr:hypothetical protein [Tanacetum cinerariifolium]
MPFNVAPSSQPIPCTQPYEIIPLPHSYIPHAPAPYPNCQNDVFSLGSVLYAGSRERTIKMRNYAISFGEKHKGCTWNARVAIYYGYDHLSTAPETELDEIIKSSAKNLVPIPSENEVTSDDESEYDVPIKDDSSTIFTTFSNPLFDYNNDFTSSDDESLPDEDVLIEEFKVYSNPLFDDDEINSDKLDPHCFNVESDFAESLLNCDTFIDTSPKFDFLLKEFSGEFAHINPEIKEADFDLEEEIRFIENLLYDNSSSRPPEELNAEIADTIVESLPSSLIPVQDNDSQREEIDIVTYTNELLPLGFKNDDSEEEIYVLEDLHVDNSIPNFENELSDNEASDFDDLLFPRPPSKPPDVEFDFEPNFEEIITAMINNNDELECFDS